MASPSNFPSRHPASSANVPSDPTTATALSYSERLALAAVGRGSTAQETDERFFVITFPPGALYGGSCGIALNSTTRRHPRLGLVSGSRGPTQIHIRGLCHWAGEPAGHLGADSPSRRAAEHASAKRTKPPCPHWLRGLSQAHHVNAVSRHRRVPPFASSRRPLTYALAHLQ